MACGYVGLRPLPTDGLSVLQCLALNRGEALGFLTVKLEWEEGSSVRKCIDAVCRGYASLPPAFQDVVHEAVQDGVHRLIKPSIDREIRAEMTDKAVKVR